MNIDITTPDYFYYSLLCFLFVIVLLLLWLIVFTYRSRSQNHPLGPDLREMWAESGLDEKIGAFTVQATDIRKTHASIEQMLRIPKERSFLGELGLETLLSDQFPPSMFGIRKRISDGKVPDAYIRSTIGFICIDSKFPLDNYRNMVESQDPKEVETFKRQFLRDVQGHLDKIAEDYISPADGSAEFAFAYIPSEAIYYFLISDAYDMLLNAVKRGVQVVSPLTLSHKVQLIKTGLHAMSLSQNATKVQEHLLRLAALFEMVDNQWKVLFDIHFRNTWRKANELDKSYQDLKEEFIRISNPDIDTEMNIRQ